MSHWKVILAHNWNVQRGVNDNSSISYDTMVDFLQNGEGVLDQFNAQTSATYKNRAKHYSILNDSLVHIVEETSAIPDWLKFAEVSLPLVFTVVHPSKKYEILTEFFNNEMTAAFNYKSLYDKVIRSYYLGISRADVIEYLKLYPPALKEVRGFGKSQFTKSYRPKYPFEHWQMDHIDFSNTELGKDPINRGYKYIFVIIDIFSKFVYIFPTKSNSLEEVFACLTKVFLSGDVPEKIGADSAFNKSSMVSFCLKYGIKFIPSMPYSPETNGFVERANGFIKRYISIHIAKFKTNQFFDILDQIAFSINNTKHSITGLPPNLVHRGRQLTIKPATVMKDLATVITSSALVQQFKNGSQSEQQSYMKARDALYQKKIEHVKDKIHKAADTRESKLAYTGKEPHKAIGLKVGSYVKIATFRFSNKNEYVKPIQLKAWFKESSVNAPFEFDFKHPMTIVTKGQTKEVDFITKLHKSKFKAIQLKTLRYSWKVPNKSFDLNSTRTLTLRESNNVFFKVTSIVRNESKVRQYTLSWTDGYGNNWNVNQLLDKDNMTFSQYFTKEILIIHHPTETTTVVRPEYLYVNMTKPISTDATKSKLVTKPSKPPSQKAHKDALKRFRTFLESLTPTSKAESFINTEIHYAFPHDTDDDIQWYFGYISQYIPNAKDGLMWEFTSTDPSEVNKSNDEKIANISLNPKLYTNGQTPLDQKFRWYFVNPVAVLNSSVSKA